MYELMKRCAAGFATVGVITLSGCAAQAQVIDDTDYAIEYPMMDGMEGEAEDDDGNDEEMATPEAGVMRCVATFRSFDPSSGTYTTYGGETRPCPYLNQ